MKRRMGTGLILALGILFLAVHAHAAVYDLNLAYMTQPFDLNIIGGTAGDTLGSLDILMGDADGDGSTDDLVLAAEGADFNSNSGVGAIYLILNVGDRNGTIDLSNTNNVDAVVYGSAANDALGGAGMAFGDADGDGKKDDLAVGAELAEQSGGNGNGVVYLFLNFGLESGTINLALNSGKVRVDMNFYGPTPTNAAFGMGNGGLAFGDADGDGNYNDLTIPSWDAPFGATSSVGKVFLIKDLGTKIGAGTTTINLQGSGSSTVPTNVATVFRGNGINSAVGSAQAAFYDVDNDGYSDDLLFGGLQSGDNGYGAFYLVKSAGTKPGMINVDTNSLVDVRVWGGSLMDDTGYAGGLLFDANGDGLTNDLLVQSLGGDYNSRTNSGSIFLLKDIHNESGTIDFGTVAGVAKIDLNIYGSVASDTLGGGQSTVGDLDGDGVKETLAISAEGYDYNGASGVGAVYLISNIASKSGAIDLNNSGSEVTHFIYGPITSSALGSAGMIFTDADRDGVTDDLFVQAHNADPAGRSNAGAVWWFDLGAPSVALDMNIVNIDGNPITQSLPVFSYVEDGNLTIDLNVIGTNTLLLDVNYSTSTTQGSGFVIVNDLNLASLSTTGAYSCADTNFLNSTRCSIDFNTAGLSDQNYYILAYLSNGSTTDYNTSGSSFLVDTNGPTLSISSPSSGSTSTESSVTFTYSGSDAASGIASYSVSTDNSTYTSNGTSTTYTFTGLTSGSYTFYVRATDNAGNTTTTSVSVTVSIPEAESEDSGGGNIFASSTPFNPPPIVLPVPTSEKTASFTITPPGTPVVLPFHHSYLHPVEKITLLSSEVLPPIALTITTNEPIPEFDQDASPCASFGIQTGKKISIPYAATIHFYVKKSCVEENESSPEEVVLYHYDSEWVPLETIFDFETEGEYYYTARTNGFSPFLIGVKKIPVSEEIIQPPVSPETNSSISEESPLIIQEDATTPAPRTQEENPLVGVFVLILLGWAAFIRLRNPPRKHHLDGW